MIVLVCLFFFTAVLGYVPSAYSADLPVLGAWRLISYARTDAVTGEKSRPWGENPTGYLMYLPDGHMSAVLTSEGRSSVAYTDEKFHEKEAQLFSSMVAYSGTYTVQGDTVTHHVEVAWQPSWVGSNQIRYAKLDGDSLTIRTPPQMFEGKNYVFDLIWKRAQ